MSKAFWEGFWIGYTKTSLWIIKVGVILTLGLIFGYYSHPYEQCKRMYETPEDISECVWIKENN